MPGSEEFLDYSKADYFAVEGCDEETFTFRWNIHKHILSNILQKEGNTMKSPECMGAKKSQHTWHLLVENKVDKYSVPIGISLYSVFKTNSEKGVQRKGVLYITQFSILDVNDKPIIISGRRKQYVVEYDPKAHIKAVWDLWRRVSFGDFKNKLICKDHLNIHCRVWLRTNKKRINSLKVELKNTHSLKTLQDFKELLLSSVCSDIVITTTTTEFKAHKCILSARSSVFAAMFESGMIEATSGKIAISDFPDTIIKEMLIFIYSGKVENMKDNEMDLLKISDKYDIQDLKLKCTQMILSSLTCENVVDIILALDRCNNVQLKNDIIDFIAKNARAVKATNGFKNLNTVHPELFSELVSSMLEKVA